MLGTFGAWRIFKIEYTHNNPIRRGLVAHPAVSSWFTLEEDHWNGRPATFLPPDQGIVMAAYEKGTIMKAILVVPIMKLDGGIRFAHLKVELPFSPHVGMPVYQIAWKDSRRIEDVSRAFDEQNEPSLSVSLEPERTENREQQMRLLEQYKGHGWDIGGNP